MDALIRCENCQMTLRVPRNAGGHQVRCAACGAYFVVPAEPVLLEETVSSWIEEDVDEVLSEREQMIEQQLAATFDREARRLERKRQQMETEALASWKGQQKSRSGGQIGARAVLPESGGSGSFDSVPEPEPETDAEPHADAEAVPEAEVIESAGANGNAGQLQEEADGRPADMPAEVVGEALPDAAQAGSPSADDYPQDLHPQQPRPHLVVDCCDHVGVRFLFDACWLENEGFRASMPVRCVFSGLTDRRQLIARPAVFVDRERGQSMPVEKLNALHEHRELGDRSSRQVMRAMGKLEALPHPFNLPMPYYVSNRYAHLFIRCRTRDRADGGVTCEMLLPDSGTALEWLTRVNGVCGRDYQLLEREASLLHGEAWRTLSDACRQRISVWCKLRPREVFRLYLSDADFGRVDEGLAGLAVTDQRLVFCKYHKRGEVANDTANAVIFVRCEGRFAHLKLQVGSERTRMVKLHRSDLNALKQVLDPGSSMVKLVVMEEGASGGERSLAG